MASPSGTTLANRRFEFTSAAFGDDKFAVVEMEGFEAVSRPFRFTLTLVSGDASIDFDTMLNHPATFAIYGPDGTMRTPYHGVLAEFEQLHRADGYVFYRAVLVPRLWRLSLYRISEVYLNEQTIPTILEGVLKNGRLTSADYAFRLTGSYRPRSFVCQFEETYLDFVSRWMEKEGLYYHFDHSGDAEKLIVLDDRIMHDANALPLSYRPDDSLDTGAAADSVRNLVYRQKPLPREVVLLDYNYRKATLPLKASAAVSETGIGEVMLYGENFRDLAEGERYAKLRAQEIVCGGKVFSGDGTAVGVRSGYRMRLAHHYRESFNGDYLVTEVHHEGSQAGALLSGVSSARGGEIVYRNSFRAIPAEVQYRAERVTAKPRVAGTMNATIDSEGSGQYADLDEYGQYKVQLPFDKTDKNANKGSARLRMATPYAGADHGMHFPLHKDAEVLLSFIDGDPDQPVIVGSLPNSENANVVTQNNAHENRIKSAGGNQIYLGDSKDKEVMWLHSPYHNSTIGIGSIDPNGGGSLMTTTAGNSESVSLGVSNSVAIGPSNKVTVGPSNALTVSTGSSFALGMNLSASYGYSASWSAGKSVSLNSAAAVSLAKKAETLGSDFITLTAGLEPGVGVAIAKATDNLNRAFKRYNLANAAIAGQAGLAVAEGADASGVSKTGKMSVDKDNPWAWSPAVVQSSASLISGLGIANTLYSASKALDTALKSSPYTSTMRLDKSGISLIANAVPQVIEEDGQVIVENAGSYMNLKLADMSMGGSGEVSVAAGSQYSVTSKGTATLKSAADFSIKSETDVAVCGTANVNVSGDSISIDAKTRLALAVAAGPNAVGPSNPCLTIEHGTVTAAGGEVIAQASNKAMLKVSDAQYVAITPGGVQIVHQKAGIQATASVTISAPSIKMG
ncbi:type VI secretion system secreted protein VgrG [Paraburkholderia caballeronis]|uniref:type VI secretion system Vgr family protein n=1 Tax=Paraburkholderia caballeronis TaxID=416943 RepID=UPI001065805C|nr:type VI secretion system tip protein TssI/VgrG [Paraburkholderia caballeronis]TDV28732.1 type VI secretion system secreted protein VgrG [Paraburkholderia caballeronis]